MTGRLETLAEPMIRLQSCQNAPVKLKSRSRKSRNLRVKLERLPLDKNTNLQVEVDATLRRDRGGNHGAALCKGPRGLYPCEVMLPSCRSRSRSFMFPHGYNIRKNQDRSNPGACSLYLFEAIRYILRMVGAVC